MNLKEELRSSPLLAILRNIPADLLLPYCEALVRGGVRHLEIAMNSVNAEEQLRLLRRTLGSGTAADPLRIGAGTVLTPETAQRALDAGADFLLSPSADPEVLDFCSSRRIPMLPGALTPTEVSACLRRGFTTIKLFPAGDMPQGYVKSLKGPFENVDFVAFGGVNRKNLADYMHQGYFAVGIGTALQPPEAFAAKDWDFIEKNAADLLAVLHAAKS